MAQQIRTLVLAGTSEARAVVDALCDDRRFDLRASLAGVTQSPATMPVPVVTGGFGGAEGLAAYCRRNHIALILDVTHPFARVISQNAAVAARAVGVACLHYVRPGWTPVAEDNWRSFDDWQAMADAIPAGSNVFLAGGTHSVETFLHRADIRLVARALNLEDRELLAHATFINALPNHDVADEKAVFAAYGITHICCKNSGGKASFAKIAAAREMGLPVWMLARRPLFADDGDGQEKQVPSNAIHDTVDGIVMAARQLASSTK